MNGRPLLAKRDDASYKTLKNNERTKFPKQSTSDGAFPTQKNRIRVAPCSASASVESITLITVYLLEAIF